MTSSLGIHWETGVTLEDAFSEVKDHRRGPAQRYELKAMIVMVICAVLCGRDGWVDIADLVGVVEGVSRWMARR